MMTEPRPLAKVVTICGVRVEITQTRSDRRGRKIWDANTDDGWLVGTGYSPGQAIARAKKRLI